MSKENPKEKDKLCVLGVKNNGIKARKGKFDMTISKKFPINILY